MSRSEIFESFIKIAQEKGLISEGEHAEHTEKDFHETNPRHDSLSIEQIGKLYGVKPDRPKDMDYKKNIMEDAHPDRLVLSPSHDKLQGLVENEIDGQNIRIHISLKDPDGHLTQRKYARKQLLLSLVKIGNQLDNRGNDELRKLADACLQQAVDDGKKKDLNKQGWVVIAAAAIAAAVGLLYLQQHKNFHSDGFAQDYQKVIAELDDLLASSVSWYGTGQSYKPEFIQQMNKFKSDLAIVNNAVQKVMPYIQSVEKPRTKSEITKEIARIAQDPKTQEATQAVAEFKKVIDEYTPEIFQVVNDFNRQSYKNEVITDKGALQKAVDWTEILHGGAGLVSDDFDDVRRGLLTLWGDIKDIYGALKQATTIQQSLQKELEQSQAQLEKLDKPETPPAKPQTPATKPEEKPDSSPWGALEEEGQGIFGGGLGGLFGK
jgi:hypothetical protein